LPENSGFSATIGTHHAAIRFVMPTAIQMYFLSSWFFDAWGELVRYFNTMSTTQWGIVSACAVAFGFLCLKGSGLNR
jgi:hypothetical protein